MRVTVKGIHLRVSRGMKAHVLEHLAQPLERICDGPATQLEVHLVDTNGPKGGLDKECRVTVRIPGSKALHVTEASEDIYKAIDFARDRVERLIKRELQKMRQTSAHPPPSRSTLARARTVALRRAGLRPG